MTENNIGVALLNWTNWLFKESASSIQVQIIRSFISLMFKLLRPGPEETVFHFNCIFRNWNDDIPPTTPNHLNKVNMAVSHVLSNSCRAFVSLFHLLILYEQDVCRCEPLVIGAVNHVQRSNYSTQQLIIISNNLQPKCR